MTRSRSRFFASRTVCFSAWTSAARRWLHSIPPRFEPVTFPCSVDGSSRSFDPGLTYSRQLGVARSPASSHELSPDENAQNMQLPWPLSRLSVRCNARWANAMAVSGVSGAVPLGGGVAASSPVI